MLIHRAGISETNYYAMRSRGFVPARHHARLLKAAAEEGVYLDYNELHAEDGII